MQSAVALQHIVCRFKLSFQKEQVEPIRLNVCLVRLDQDAFACESAGNSVMAIFFWAVGC